MTALEAPGRRGTRLLLIDDDRPFCEVLGRALGRRGFEVEVAHDLCAAIERAQAKPPDLAIVDLRMDEASGLELVPRLLALNPGIRVVVLSAYASIATAVEAIKLGAVHYLTKPAEVDEIVAAFGRDRGDQSVPVPRTPTTLGRLEWEHIQKVLLDAEGNVSEAARRLGLHRRTLQRKLQKRPAGLG